jgi:hypothetical protein
MAIKSEAKAVKAKVVSDAKFGSVTVVSIADAKSLEASGHVTIVGTNDTQAQVQPTEKLIAEFGASEAAPTSGDASNFPIDAVPLPEKTHSGSRPETYPFSQLQVGQSFFVANKAGSEKDAVAAMAGTVGAANRRFSVAEPNGATYLAKNGETRPKMVLTRKFEIRRVKAGQTYAGSTFIESADGARIYRTA